MNYHDERPNPDVLLKNIRTNEPKKVGKLKIFFGYAAGVGKTYAMLDDAQEQLKNGVNVLVGYVEPHTRSETMQLLEGLPVLPPMVVNHRNIQLREFDLDSALEKNPNLSWWMSLRTPMPTDCVTKNGIRISKNFSMRELMSIQQ